MSRVLWILIAATALFVGCAADAVDVPLGPDGEPDPELVVGRDVWSQSCSRCHGNDGGGGSGPKLSDGKVTEAFSDPADMGRLILDGRGGMPSFSGKLSESEVEPSCGTRSRCSAERGITAEIYTVICHYE